MNWLAFVVATSSPAHSWLFDVSKAAGRYSAGASTGKTDRSSALHQHETRRDERKRTVHVSGGKCAWSTGKPVEMEESECKDASS